MTQPTPEFCHESHPGSAGPPEGRVAPALVSLIESARGLGCPLEGGLRERMGAALGHDLRDVRIHTDSRAQELSRALQARAFAIGRDVFFARGAWSPESEAGRELLAHELVHVIQQGDGRVPLSDGSMLVRPPDDRLEREADLLGRRAAARPTPARAPRARTSFSPALAQSLVIQRTAAQFANHSKTAPTFVAHNHGKNCHMSALFWAFRDAGDTAAVAAARINAIQEAKCPGCLNPPSPHGPGNNSWYGDQLCDQNDAVVADRAALRANTAVGDVLWVGDYRMPSHSMVLVSKTTLLNRHWISIRGFNNTGCLGAGPKDAYDDANRDIDKDKYWHTLGGNTRFGTTYRPDMVLHRIPYATYATRAGIVRGNCQNAGGNWTYVGP